MESATSPSRRGTSVNLSWQWITCRATIGEGAGACTHRRVRDAVAYLNRKRKEVAHGCGTFSLTHYLYRSLSRALSLSIPPHLSFSMRCSGGGRGGGARVQEGCEAYRVTSLIRNCFLLEPYNRPMSRVLGRLKFLMSEVPLYARNIHICNVTCQA